MRPTPYTRIRAVKKRRKRGRKKKAEGWKLVGGTFVNVAPLTSAEKRREKEREKERKRRGKETYDGHIHADGVYAHTPRTVQGFSTRSLEIWDPLDKAGSSHPPPPLSLSLPLSPSVPRDLLITLESECSLALRIRPEGERAKHRVCSAASGEQSAAASTGCDIYRASGSPAIFPRQSVTSMGN